MEFEMEVNNMRTIIKKLVAVVTSIAIVLSFSTFPVNANSNVDENEGIGYSSMTTEALVEFMLAEDYGISLFITDDHSSTYSFLLNTYPVFEELESRSDATSVLMASYTELTEQGASFVDIALISLLLSQPIYRPNTRATILDYWISYFTEEEHTYLNPPQSFYYLLHDITVITYTQSNATHTLNNSDVVLYTPDHFLTTAEKNELDYSLLRAYEHLDQVASANTWYNCHSYAWYQRTTNAQGFMPFVDYYMLDPHYETVSKSSAQVGDIVVYRDADGKYTHSAVIVDINTGSSMVPIITCESKMGICGVFRHDISYVPELYYAGYSTPQYVIKRFTTSHDYEYTQYNAASHARTCEHCGTEYLSHNKTVTTKTGLNHTLKCYDCGWTRTEAHIYLSGSTKCKTCGYNNSGHSTASIELPPTTKE
jgi:hypothetical protein